MKAAQRPPNSISTKSRAINQSAAATGRLEPKKRRRQRAQDLPVPHPIGQAELEEIFCTFRVGFERRPMLAQFLQELVEVFADAVQKQIREPSIRADREALIAALSGVKRARKMMNRPFGPVAQDRMRAFGPRLGSAVAAAWLRENFPDDELVPSRSAIPIDRSANRLRYPDLWRLGRNGHSLDIEQLSIEARCNFVSERPARTTVALLDALQMSLSATIDLMVRFPPRGGQKPLINRKYVLINLAEVWSRLGRRPSGGPKSEFVTFCEYVFEAIGWPARNVEHAVARAIPAWRDLARKNRR